MFELRNDDIKDMMVIVEKRLRVSSDLTDEEYRSAISGAVSSVLGPKGYCIRDKCSAVERLYSMIRGFDILQPLMDDPMVTDIMVNGSENVFYEKSGQLSRYDRSFKDSEHLMNFIHKMFDAGGKPLSEKNPIADITLRDGSRANAVIRPVAVDGPFVSIRKFTYIKPDMSSLISSDFLTQEQSVFLTAGVKEGKNIFVTGGTGTGKTTFVNALSAYIPESERVIIIEDSPELNFINSPNIVRLQIRTAFADKTAGISMSDLIRCALRMRPDRIIVGEVRGKEASDMLWAMNTGHKGSLSTGHSNSAADMLSRLCIMVRSADDLPADIVNTQIASAIDIIVHLSRSVSGTRYIHEIITVNGYKDGRYILEKF